jgi:two-component system chemotaxis sensor kinase CheA
MPEAMQVAEMPPMSMQPASMPVVAAPSIAPVAPVIPPKVEAALAARDEEAGGKPQARVAKPAATTTRIELEKIDRVVNMVGELVIAQAMLGQIVQDMPEAVNGRLTQILDEVVHHTRELKDGLMSMRAQAVGSVFQRMPRLVRETALKVGKKIRLELSGETTEVDRSIIERLTDPLTHIIRNSVDHGIELPEARVAAGTVGACAQRVHRRCGDRRRRARSQAVPGRAARARLARAVFPGSDYGE